MTASGNKVEYVNVFLPDTSLQPMRADYWEQNSIYWGYGYGHNWRYMIFQTSVESDPQLDYIDQHPSTWSAIESGIFKVFVERTLDGISGGVWSVITDMATILQEANPTNYTFNAVQGEEISSGASGFVYHKDIIIEDTLDKVDGYNYWPWGTVEKLETITIIKVKWWNQGTGWGITLEQSPMRTTTTPLYGSASALWDVVADKYSLLGYNYYYEFILTNNLDRGTIE